MYIPTQEERYSNVAAWTLLICVIAPPALVAWVHSEMDMMAILGAFTWPLAYPLMSLTGHMPSSLIVSALVQLGLLLWLRRRAWTAKRKLTFAICWGMLFALLVRLIMVAELKASVIRALMEQP